MGVIPFIFDLMNGLGPHYPQCVCAPPPCAATANAVSASQATVVGQTALVEPLPPVQSVPPPYVGGGGGYGGLPPNMYSAAGYPYRRRYRR
ncbi:unnamed protein product [Strongylus vulgaris]|uniref:Uncharacterized protein n=1 Tax=Strongylus vulgaris TaxID=40348 RepID=A0A3P7LCA4_STRVU|nr:unnamed protein product [Strongylus vulgaris]